jgi:hypothetical protein
MITMGNTRVLITATVEDKTAPFLKGTGSGWITAEYSMLPRAGKQRSPREVVRGTPTGRTMEIQRLIGRVAEVAARFTLDAMPGKQMAIDADLNAGLIDQAEAKRRRRAIELEADFYGAMDGASKFVKGDAIAAILIILINIIGGFAAGFLRGQGDALTVLQTYTLLTVGEGLVAQIPALLISTATGLLVTRASTEQAMGQDVVGQVLQYPRVLMAAGAALAFLSACAGLSQATVSSHRRGAVRAGLPGDANVNLLPPPPEPEQPEETCRAAPHRS